MNEILDPRGRGGYVIMVCLAGAASCPAQKSQPGINPLQLAQRTAALRARVTELAGTDQLLDTLHFAWFDRPYARAELAVLLKTVATLERESDRRARGNGAVADEVVTRMLAWCDRALTRVAEPEPDRGFRPHRFRAAVDARSTVSVGAPLYAFMDRATATRAGERFGDLDVLASLGQRAYVFPPGAAIDGENALVRTARARALGMAVVAVQAPGSARTEDAPEAGHRGSDAVLTLRPVTLQGLLHEKRRTSSATLPIPAVIDPPRGEPIASSLARRALARGMLGQRRTMCASWRSATIPDGSAAAPDVPLTMWIHALDGQALAVLPGWRDIRDGTRSPFGSAFIKPGHLETIAATALDVLRLGSFASSFTASAPLAVLIDADAIDPRDDNRWAAWVEPIWNALLDRQIHFDVVRDSAVDPDTQFQYRALVSLRRDVAADPDAFIAKVEQQRGAPQRNRLRATLVDTNGEVADKLFMRQGRTPQGKTCIAAANLSDRPRRLSLRGAGDLEDMRDVIAGEPIEEPRERIDFKPWQVRLLWPAE